MADGWSPELADRAERVPVWTRAAPARFTGAGPGFAAWIDREDLLYPNDADSYAPPVDPLAQGFAQGYSAGEAALDEERAALRRLAGSLQALRAEPPADLARLLAETVLRLVTRIVGEVALDEAAVARRAAAAAALIAEETAPTRLRLSTADFEQLAGSDLPVELVVDTTLAPGALLLETATGWIEDGPAVRLERLRTALDGMAY